MNVIFPIKTQFVEVPRADFSPQDILFLVTGYHLEGDLDVYHARCGDTASTILLPQLGGHAFRQIPSGVRLALVCIPSFSGAFNGNPQATLETLSALLTDLRNRSIPVTRVLHLHDMSQKRITEAMQTDLEVLRGILGPGFYPKLVFSGTYWASDSSTVLHGEKREKELAEGLWKPFIEGGAQVVRFASPNWRKLVSGQGDDGDSTQGLRDAERTLANLVTEAARRTPTSLFFSFLMNLPA